MTGTRRNGLEVYAMIPASVVRGQCHDGCCDVYAILDLTQGANGRPFRGIRSLSEELGWGRPRVRRHVDHLVDAGLVEPLRDGQHKVVFRVCNPARIPRLRGFATDPPVGTPQTHPRGHSGFTTDPPPRSYRSDIGNSHSSSSDFEQVSADDEVVEIRDFDVDDWAAELARFESANGNGSVPVREPEDVWS
jgi:hypothetical protein